MSEIKVNSIKGVGASTAAITVNNTDGTCTANITNNLSNRNKVINGGMVVDQRNNGSTTTAISSGYTLDRFRIVSTSTDQLAATIQQVESETDAPAGTGLTRSLKWTTTTPETSIESDEVIRFEYRIEGNDIQDFCYGTSNAKTVTVSFYVKTSVTGVYALSIFRNETNDRMINRTYTVSDTNWNRYTFTIAGDTAEKISTGTASRWRMMFHLAAGSDFTTSTHSTWGAYSTPYFAGGHVQNGVCTTNGATWQLTGVQLEVGSVATDFEHRSFGQELALCQRYFYKTYNQATTPGTATSVNAFMFSLPVSQNYASMPSVRYPVTMRATPTVTAYSTQNANTTGVMSADSSDKSTTIHQTGENGHFPFVNNSSSGISVNVFLRHQFTASAEL